MVTISVNNNTPEVIPLVVHVITGLITVICLACCAVEGRSLLYMEIWLGGALLAFFVNRFCSGIIGRMITL